MLLQLVPGGFWSKTSLCKEESNFDQVLTLKHQFKAYLQTFHDSMGIQFDFIVSLDRKGCN